MAMKCCVCVPNSTACYIIALVTAIGMTLVLIHGSYFLHQYDVAAKAGAPVSKSAIVAEILALITVVITFPTCVLLALAVKQERTGWFFPIQFAYVFDFILYIAHTAIVFTVQGLTAIEIIQLIVYLTLIAFFFVVVNYHRKEVMNEKDQIQQLHGRRRY